MQTKHIRVFAVTVTAHPESRSGLLESSPARGRIRCPAKVTGSDSAILVHAMHLHWHVKSLLPRYDRNRTSCTCTGTFRLALFPHYYAAAIHLHRSTGTPSRSQSRMPHCEAMQHLHSDWHCQWNVHGCHIMTPCRRTCHRLPVPSERGCQWHVHDYHIMTSGHWP